MRYNGSIKGIRKWAQHKVRPKGKRDLMALNIIKDRNKCEAFSAVLMLFIYGNREE